MVNMGDDSNMMNGGDTEIGINSMMPSEYGANMYGGSPEEMPIFNSPARLRHGSGGTIPTENRNEAMYLFIISAVGLFLNLVVIMCILLCKSLRKMTSAFIMHGCILDIVKCGYCIPFARSLLKDVAPSFCTVLGGSYVVIVTASGFNIVAMICCEAYTFSEHNMGGQAHGSLCCVVFGVVMVYIGSVIIHLGPTIIGGDFNYNDLIGNCIFVYGPIKSYVVHVMWIAIMTLAMVGAVYYLVFFYKHVQANSTHRLASLVRASIALSRGNTQNQNIRKLVQDSLGRARVLITITALFILCWYPLFILTVVDPKFKQPTKIYKLLTFIAWSNAAINPLVLVLFDRNINVLQRIVCPCCRASAASADDDDREAPLMPASTSSRTPSLSRSSSRHQAPLSQVTVYKNVGQRLSERSQMYKSQPLTLPPLI